MCLLQSPDDTRLLSRLFSPNGAFQEAIFEVALEKRSGGWYEISTVDEIEDVESFRG